MKKQARNRYFLASIIFIMFFLCAEIKKTQAYGAPDYLPDGPHPRIWLDSEMMTALEAKQQNSDPDWINLELWCDSHINDPYPTTKDYSWGDLGNGYRGSGYLVRLKNYALGYQVLKSTNQAKADQYANYAIGLMNKMVEVFSAGEELDGISMIRMGASSDITINAGEAAANGTLLQGTKNGYTARNFGFAFPIAYDWLYEKISINDRNKFLNVMYRWMDWSRGIRSSYNNGILLNGIRYHEDKNGDCTGNNNCTSQTGIATRAYQNEQAGVNFQTDLATMDALIAISTYGDSADSNNYLSKFKTERWETQLKPYLLSELYFKGGDSLEGMSYFSSWQDLILGMYAYSQSTGDDLFLDLDWPKEVLTSYIQQTASNLTDVVGEGDWPGNSIRKAYEKFVIGPAYVIRRKYPSDSIGAIAQDYIKKTNFSLLDYLVNRLMWREDVPSLSLSSLPLSNVAIGTGLAVMRSTWSNSSDFNFTSIQLGQGWRMSHQSYDQGNILIQRGSDLLLARNVALTTTLGHNTVVFNNSQQYAMNPLPSTPPIKTFDDNGDYFYIVGDLGNAHKRQYNPDLCKLFLREMIFVRPNYYIVKDTTRSNVALGNLKDWYTNYVADPTLDDANKTISAKVGSSKIFTKTLFPSNGTFTETNPSSGYYRVKFTPAVSQEYDQFLHVIEATGSTDSQTPAILIEGIGGRGALIENQNENIITMFTADQNAADISLLLYSTNTTASSKHIITNLTPNQNYDVKIDTGNIAQYIASSAGIIEFTNSTTGTHSYAINIATNDSVAPASPSGLNVQ